MAGPTISAIESSDWFSPSTTPCSLRETCCVIRLVSAGRSTPVPKEARVAASKSGGIAKLTPSSAYPTAPLQNPSVTSRASPMRRTSAPWRIDPCTTMPSRPEYMKT